MDEGGRLDLPRRVVLISLGASALAMWPARLRAASDRAPDRSPRVADAATAGDVARAVLYEEDPGEPKGKRFAGDVRWSFDIRSSGGNEAPDFTQPHRQRGQGAAEFIERRGLRLRLDHETYVAHNVILCNI